MWRNWKKNGRYWKKSKTFDENLGTLLEFTLLKPPTVGSKDEERTDCGVCYAQYLPADDELGVSSGGSPDYACENSSCGPLMFCLGIALIVLIQLQFKLTGANDRRQCHPNSLYYS